MSSSTDSSRIQDHLTSLHYMQILAIQVHEENNSAATALLVEEAKRNIDCYISSLSLGGIKLLQATSSASVAALEKYEQQKRNDAEAASRASAIEGTNDSNYDPLNDEVLDQTFCEASGKTKAATKTEEAPKQPRNLAAYDADLVSRELDSKLYPPKRFAYRSNQYVTPEDDEAVKKILAAKPNLCPKYITQMIARNRLPNILPSIAQLIDLNNDKLSIATLKKIESAAKNARIYQERKQRE